MISSAAHKKISRFILINDKPLELTKHKDNLPETVVFEYHTQMIDPKLHLKSIHCCAIRTHSHACIVDQVVKSLLSWKTK